MIKSARIHLAFLAASIVLSLHSVPYRVLSCVPPPPHGDDSPEALVAGTASTPYQYRVLVPWIVRNALRAHLVTPERQLAAFAFIEWMSLVALAAMFRRYLSIFIDHLGLTSALALSVYAFL